MSSEQAHPTSDLRAAAQDYKREEQQKAKWALGPKYAAGRADAHPRPLRPSDGTCSTTTRWERRAAARLDGTGKAKLARKRDMMSAGQDSTSSEDSSHSAEEDVDAEATAPDAQVMYSFDASRAPSQGSQILNAALAKAINKYEDKETTKLVKNEYEVLDAQADEENMGLTPGRSKDKSTLIDAEDEEYEFL